MDIQLREHGPAQDVPRLPGEVRQGLAPLVEVSNGGAGRSRVRPGRKVGVLQVADVTVYVQPKIDIAQLLFLVDYATKPVGWRDPLAGMAEAGDLAATVAEVYVRLAERALSRGPLHGYQPTKASLPVLKGRLRLADQIAARHGAPFPFEVSYTTYGPDIPENRTLAAAAEAALRLHRLRPDTRARLGRVLRQLPAASPPPPASPTTGPAQLSWQPTRLNAHYADALRMAELILRGSAFGPVHGVTPACGFVLDMPVVFENFLCTALGEAMSTRVPGRWQPRHPLYLDVAGQVPIKPDFAFMVNGRPVAIADAKYKAGYDRVPEDIYQMVVYCTSLGIPRGHLVYAEGTPGPLVHQVRQSGVRVVRHALDLGQPRDRLLAAVDRLADELVADVRSAPVNHAPMTTIPFPGGRA
jgi:5-methylcytosine-specific restriction enzyme subunit McrC